jgi:hypothetical protein
MPNLVATFTQMDDAGTLNVEITTENDYNNKSLTLFRPPADAVFNPDKDTYFPRTNLQKKLSSFVKVNSAPFNYEIYKDTTDVTTLLW